MTDDRFVSYAHNLEDVLLWRALSHDAGSAGFYVDAGAADPTTPSVTRSFYERGWRGIDVAALPEQAERLREARPRDVVIEATFAAGPGLAGVRAFSLGALCGEHVHGPIHFMRVDAGGTEGAVLAGADWDQARPWVLVVAAPGMPPSVPEWEEALLAARYDFVWFDGLNRFYLAREHAALARHFRVPPNALDRYTVHDAGLNQLLAETIALSHSRADALEELQAQFANLQRRLDRLQGKPAPEDAPAPDATAEDASGRLAGAPGPVQVSQPPEVQVPPPPIGLAYRRGGIARRLAMGLYRLVRPVARPLAWRGRTFLIGPVRDEVAVLRDRIERLAVGQAGAGALDNSVSAHVMERLLLTLALQNGRDPAPPGLAPEHRADPSGLSNPPPPR